jgi:hypothetical protein
MWMFNSRCLGGTSASLRWSSVEFKYRASETHQLGDSEAVKLFVIHRTYFNRSLIPVCRPTECRCRLMTEREYGWYHLGGKLESQCL